MKLVLLVAATAVLAGLAFAAAAGAKGPSQATIAGPGLDHAIVLRGDAESSASSRFSVIVQESGFFATVFGGQVPDPTLRARPTGDLGPRYDVVYTVPGPGTASKLRAELYPYATPAPVAHMPAGQRFWDGRLTRGGWVRGDATLRGALVAAGLPAKAPTSGSSLSAGAWAGIGSGSALAVLAFGSVFVRRRPRGRDA
jgi:hypothetical protein